jgi:hypothetical protein
MRKAIAAAYRLAVLFSVTALAQTPVEVQPVKELKPTGSLGTCGYVPSAKEKLFFDRLAAKERTTGSFMERYDIHQENGKFVSWYGIVRKINRVPQSDSWELILEHKYFDGLTDCHIMLVSMSGSGDFAARVQANDAPIPALALVRIYGTVREQENGIPLIGAESVRVWPWLTFTFTDLGAEDKTNPRWRKDCKICEGGRVYRAYPDERHYRDALGDPQRYGVFLK